MAMRQRRRRHARAAAFVDAHLPLVWGYAAGMLQQPALAHEVARSVLGDIDPRLLGEDDEPALRRLLLVRTRRAVTEAAARAGGAVAPDAGSQAPVPAAVRDGFAGLDVDEREALVLLDVLAVGDEEAAALCDAPPEELARRRHRAHRHLVGRLLGTEP